MKQSARVRPEPTLQRKAIVAAGGVQDQAGNVRIEPIPDFDLNQTIFQTLEGKAERFVMKTRVAKTVEWDETTASSIAQDYAAARETHVLPEIDPELLAFMVNECDFDVEHADGSFLDHLYFCFEYTVQHLPQHPALVMLLHSILGTGTNTFAMPAEKIPMLRALLSEEEWRHIEAFPSVLRLLYHGPLRTQLRENAHRINELKSVEFHRVIDNEPITLDVDELWIQLNYQLIHLLDFLPVANWTTHQNDTAFIIFRDLYNFLAAVNKRNATVAYNPTTGPRKLEGESCGMLAWMTTWIPVGLSEKLAARSIERFSSRIGHSLDITLNWD